MKLHTLVVFAVFGLSLSGCSVLQRESDDSGSNNSGQGGDSASTGVYIYTANTGANTVSLTELDPSTGVPTFIDSYATGAGPRGITVSNNKRFLFVANKTDFTISRFSIDPDDGTLTELGKTDLENDGIYLLMHPTLDILYAAGSEAPSGVEIYAVDSSTGDLTQQQGLQDSGMAGAFSMSFTKDDPSNPKYILVSNGDSSITVYEIQGKGDLLHRHNALGNLSTTFADTFIDDNGDTHVYTVGWDVADFAAGGDIVTFLTLIYDDASFIKDWDWTNPSTYHVIEENPTFLLVDETNSRFLTANLGSDNISVMDIDSKDGTTSENIAPVTLPNGNPASSVRGPTHLIIYDNYLIVTEYVSGSVSVLNYPDLTAVSNGIASTGTQPVNSLLIDLN